MKITLPGWIFWNTRCRIERVSALLQLFVANWFLHPWRRLAAVCLAAFLLLLALDSALFRTGIYTSVLDPNSSTGLFELTLRRELNSQIDNGDNMIVTVGDSRFACRPAAPWRMS